MLLSCLNALLDCDLEMKCVFMFGFQLQREGFPVPMCTFNFKLPAVLLIWNLNGNLRISQLSVFRDEFKEFSTVH